MSKGIVHFSPTGTTGRRLSMELTGKTYKNYAGSLFTENSCQSSELLLWQLLEKMVGALKNVAIPLKKEMASPDLGCVQVGARARHRQLQHSDTSWPAAYTQRSCAFRLPSLQWRPSQGGHGCRGSRGCWAQNNCAQARGAAKMSGAHFRSNHEWDSSPHENQHWSELEPELPHCQPGISTT
jgi:hypothetical protein